MIGTKDATIAKDTKPRVVFVLAAMMFVSFVAPARTAVDVTDADLEAASGGRTIAVGAISKDGRVSHVPLEVYVARVLAGEGEPNAPEDAEEALAIAIRTFAIVNKGRHARDGFDVCDTTHCQVPRAATAATRRAALATAGRIITYNGKPAPVFYSASCGGRSEDAAAVWPGANFPYMQSIVDDVHEDDVPWTVDLPLSQVEQALRKAGFDGRLKDVRVEERDRSGRVARVRLRGLEPDEIAGEQFRFALGATLVRSTAFSIEKDGSHVRLTGRGYGHGVGMCVIGAGRRARRGESAEAILRTYYRGTEIVSLDRVPTSTIVPDVSTARVAEPAPVKRLAPPIDSAVTGIVARVSKDSPISATELARIGARAHEALSARLGTSVAPLTIDLHDSLDGFRNATGQPWWVSEVAAGNTIDLAPAAVLEQRDGVEEAVRQAIASLLVAPALTGRPAWVRVGAARYFARQTPMAPPAGRLKCPADAELTLAISAASQRDAEYRAEACFAKEIASGKNWRQVGR